MGVGVGTGMGMGVRLGMGVRVELGRVGNYVNVGAVLSSRLTKMIGLRTFDGA